MGRERGEGGGREEGEVGWRRGGRGGGGEGTGRCGRSEESGGGEEGEGGRSHLQMLRACQEQFSAVRWNMCHCGVCVRSINR